MSYGFYVFFLNACMSINVYCDRNADEMVGLDFGPKPKVWRVYHRKNKKENKKGDVAGMLHGMHEAFTYI
jgi:hypothetical protein